VTVTAPEQRTDEVVLLMDRFDPVDVQERATNWREEGWQGFQPATMPPAEPIRSSPMSPVAAGYVAETSRLDDLAGGTR